MARLLSRSLPASLTRIHLALILCCLSVAGCARQESPVLRIGASMWPGFETFFLARERKFWRNDQINLLEHTSGTPSTLQKQAQSLADVMTQRKLLLRSVDVASMFERGSRQRGAP